MLWFPLAAWSCFWLTFEVLESTYLTYTIAIAVLALADTCGAFVGKRWGVHRYRVARGHYRSLEGSAAVAVAAFACVWLPLWGVGNASPQQAAIIALSTAVLCSALEAVSRWGSDNITLPLGSLLYVHWALGAPQALVASTAAGAALLAIGVVAVMLGRSPVSRRRAVRIGARRRRSLPQPAARATPVRATTALRAAGPADPQAGRPRRSPCRARARLTEGTRSDNRHQQ